MDKNKQFLYDLLNTTTKDNTMIYTLNILTEYQEAASDPSTPLFKIASIIEKDPGLTSVTLKTANSSYYGFSKNIRTVKQAISILGFRTLERILLTQVIKSSFASKNQPILDDLWRHSLTTAIIAQLMLAPRNQPLSEQAFIAGLLHDLGKFILFNFQKDKMDDFLQTLTQNPQQYSVCLELEKFDIDHQEVGEFFARKWLFPENISNTIKYHHSLYADFQDKDMIYTVAIANNIAKAMELGKSSSGLIELLPHYVFQHIDFKVDDFEGIVLNAKNKFYELTSYLED